MQQQGECEGRRAAVPRSLSDVQEHMSPELLPRCTQDWKGT